MMWIYRAVNQAAPDLVTFEVGYIQAQEAVLVPTYTAALAPPVVDVFRPVEKYDTREEARAAVHYLNGGGLEKGQHAG